jgi:hypothetical protein
MRLCRHAIGGEEVYAIPQSRVKPHHGSAAIAMLPVLDASLAVVDSVLQRVHVQAPYVHKNITGKPYHAATYLIAVRAVDTWATGLKRLKAALFHRSKGHSQP